MATHLDGSRSQASTRGFTLVELLVSLGLLSMAAALVLACLQMAGVVARRDRGGAVALEQVVAAHRLLRTLIERMRPAMRVDSALPIVDARGTATVLSFIAPPLESAMPDALQRYRLVRTPDGALVLFGVSIRRIGIDRDGTDMRGWTPMPMLTGVASIAIDYYGVIPGYGATPGWRKPVWQPRWWDRRQMPELVRIRLSFGPGDRRAWPELIVRPRATTGTTCRIDLRTAGCDARS